MKEIKGCNALLTGASRGIGVLIANRLAEEGVNLALVARTADKLDSVRDEITRKGVRAIAVPSDLSRLDSLEDLVRNVEHALGPIHLLINNAGIETIAAYENLSMDEIKTGMEVNLVAPMLLTRIVLPGMLKRGRGHVVFISSTAGMLPLPFAEVYSTTKHGLIGFSYSLNASFQEDKLPLTSSVVCAGAVSKVGVYQRLVDRYGNRAEISKIFGTSKPEKVADAVLRAILRDEPFTVVGKFLLALHVLYYKAPRLIGRIAHSAGWFDPLHFLSQVSGRGRDSH